MKQGERGTRQGRDGDVSSEMEHSPREGETAQRRVRWFSATRRGLCLALMVLPLAAQDRGSLPILPQSPGTSAIPADRSFAWRPALGQSMRALLAQHGWRLAFQPGTRRLLGGPFFKDWGRSVKATSGWGDGDHWIINYALHPIQGAGTGYIQVQNDPLARGVEFGNTPEYWHSRLRALAWNTAYSVQFEVGPISESSIGNVGYRKGTSGYVDHVMTPLGGFAVMIAEDALDKYVIRKWEDRTRSVAKRTFYRIALNPCRSLANAVRGKGPWHRENRSLVPQP